MEMRDMREDGLSTSYEQYLALPAGVVMDWRLLREAEDIPRRREEANRRVRS